MFPPPVPVTSPLDASFGNSVPTPAKPLTTLPVFSLARPPTRSDMRFDTASLEEAARVIERHPRSERRCYARAERPQAWYGSWPFRRRLYEVPCPPTTTSVTQPTTTLDPNRICKKTDMVMQGTGLSNVWKKETRVVPCPETAANHRGKRLVIDMTPPAAPGTPAMCETVTSARKFGQGMLGFWKVETARVPCDSLHPPGKPDDCVLL